MPRVFRRAVTSAAVLALGLGGALVAIAPAYAATTPVTLPGDANVPGTLRYAVNEANAEPGQSVITIEPLTAITLDSTLVLTEGVTITGGDGVVIERSGSFDFFQIAPDVGKDAQDYFFGAIQLDGDAVAQTGRGIVANTAVPFDSLTADETRFFDLVGAVGSGGAVLVDQAANGPVILSGTAFIGNAAPISGGAVSVTNAASLTVDGFGTASDNSSAIGGAFAANDVPGPVTFDEVFIDDNEATAGDGGAIALHNVGSAAFSGSDVMTGSNNTASGNGGYAAIDDVPGTVSVTDGYFHHNEATDGGAFWIEDVATFTIDRGLIEANNAADEGGGVYVTGETVPVFTDVQLTGNSAETRGGGAAVVNTETKTIAGVTINGGSFIENSAARGGGLALEVTDLAVVQGGTLFDDNSATGGGGGGIQSSGTVQSLQFTDVTLQYNDAYNGVGGGIYILGAYETTLTNVDMSTNEAEVGGGGLYVNVFNTSVLVQDSSFVGNVVQEGSGGAINIQSVDQGNSFTLLRSTLDRNSVDGDDPVVGGGLAIGSNGGTVKVDSSTFIDNAVTPVTGNGTAIGAIQFNSGVYDIVNSTFEETETDAFAIWFPGNVGTVLLHSNTITALGGIGLDQNSGTVTIQNTIIDATGTLETVFIGGEDSDPAAAQYSLLSDAFDPANVAAAATNRFEVADMRLAPLALNGGPTLTRLPAVNSPAVGNGNAAVDAILPATDQRGPGFPRVLGVLDIGAVEIPQPLAATGSTGLPVWVPIVGGIVLLLGIAAVVFSVINRRKSTGAADSTAEPPAENDPR